MRDITLGDTIYREFSTRAFGTGIPTTLLGSPVVSWSENGGVNSSSGVTLTVDLNSITGNHLLTIVATSGNGFENGKDYSFKITAGTVAGVSVVGEKIESFSIGRSAAAVDLANGTDGLGAIKNDTTTALGGLSSVLTGQADIKGTSFVKDTHSLKQVLDDVTGIAGQAMRGTDSANTVVPDAAGTAPTKEEIRTEMDSNSTKLIDIVADTNELQSDDIPALIGNLNDVAAADIVTAGAITTLTGAIVNVDLVDTLTTYTGNTKQTADHTASIAAIPTVTEITTDINSNLDKTGFSLSTAGILAIWHQSLTNIVTAGSIGKLLKDEITAVRMATLTDWIDGGRLDNILDELTAQGNTNETKIDIVNTDLSNSTDGLGALKILIDTVNADLSNSTDGLGALKDLIDGLNDIDSASILTTALTESYAADGATATLSQLMYMIWSLLNSLKFVTTTGTSRKLDGTTAAMTFTIDDANNPTDINRTT
jgi:hypothetical protein